MSADDVTLGEIGRRVSLMHEDLREMRSTMVTHNDLTAALASSKNDLAAHTANADLHHKRLDERIASLEAWNTWAVRIVLGAVLAGVMALVLAQR